MDMGLEQIVIEQYQWILGLARKYCRNMMDAEDLAEETVYKILSNKSKYDSSKSFRPWCSVIMLNTYITTYNHESLIRFDSEEKADHIHSYFDADNETLRNELYGIIEKCRRKSYSEQTRYGYEPYLMVYASFLLSLHKSNPQHTL